MMAAKTPKPRKKASKKTAPKKTAKASGIEKRATKKAAKTPKPKKTASKMSAKASGLKKTAPKKAAKTPKPKKTASKMSAKASGLKKKASKKKAKAPAIEETPEELRARNLTAFEKHMPQLHPFLVNHKPQSTLVYTEDGEPDVEFRGVKLYDGRGAYTYAKEQLGTFWRAPNRMFFNLMDSSNLDSHAGLFGAKLMKRAMEDGIVFRKVPDSKDCYFMIIMGIGLAPHLMELIDETKCQHVILIEPNMEFLFHSTFVFDWAELFEQFTSGRRIQIVGASKPEDIAAAVKTTIRSENPSGLDGTYFYTHYHNAALRDALDDLYGGELAIGMLGLGFFEDEINMVAQTYANLQPGKSRIMAEITTTIDIPVIIAAAGPSLDGCLDLIKEYQDDVVIIGCGSALDPLIAKGIVPDFLVLLERDPDLLPFMQGSAEEYDLSGICLVGATNVYPGISDLYDDAIFFFRPGISSFPVLSQNQNQMMAKPDPLVANGAVSFAQRAGFREFYFFGVDVGAKNPDYHHSKGSWYTTKGMKMEFGFDSIEPGNFGGTVSSAKVFNWSRITLENSIKAFSVGRHYYNCSDGALIEGAMPKHPSTLTLKKVGNKREVVKDIIEKFPIYTTEEVDEVWEKADLFNAIPAFKDKLVKVLEDNDFSSMSYMVEAMKLLKPPQIDDGVAMIYRGTVFQVLMLLHSYGMRLPSEESKTKFHDIACEEFEKLLDQMKDEALDFFEAVQSGTHVWNT